ncbi:hypothetical protein [Sideroxydans sp. CL21]|jgi:hypothetical protein|uniref:hypothetical protein n=1 Tax=Sideroxydans sp. CL21 TaxID=2600596 RepID=UPI0012AA7974|nr:hypothetical protein [Sideroxydans sp. CL21]VVC85238.1 hypothetical protein [Sideroxydans sp. CL21]
MSAAIFSLIGIVAGGSLQYFFTRHLDSQKYHRDLRTKSYTDYLKSVCDLANLGIQPKSPEAREMFAKTADAKARICLYGSVAAIAAFAEFERLGATMNTAEQRATFTRMVAIMRSDSGSKQDVVLKDLEAVLIGVRH